MGIHSEHRRKLARAGLWPDSAGRWVRKDSARLVLVQTVGGDYSRLDVRTQVPVDQESFEIVIKDISSGYGFDCRPRRAVGPLEYVLSLQAA